MQTLEYLKDQAAHHRNMARIYEKDVVKHKEKLQECEVMIAELEAMKPLPNTKPTIIDATATEQPPSGKRGIMRWG